MTISELVKDAHETALEKGWWVNPDRNFGEQLMLMVTELAEVMEEYRRSGPDALDALSTNSHGPVGIASEFADVLIRIADTCGRYNIPLDQALIAKLAYNKTRPYRHGAKHA